MQQIETGNTFTFYTLAMTMLSDQNEFANQNILFKSRQVKSYYYLQLNQLNKVDLCDLDVIQLV